jgi:pyruvate/2-oxoglutarate dehydrogenase complex dihydrolipoamide dehydrogenase (E3) component
VVLNTGTEPVEPPIPGLRETPYWTNRDAVQLKELPASLIVIGGGAIGAELAQTFCRFGVRVTVLEGGERILALEEPEASAIVAETFDSAGINVVTKAKATSVRYADEQFTVTLEDQVLSGERLLVATGRRPNLADVGLEAVGLDPQAKALEVDDRLRAGPGLWALGDITGKGGFTHVSMYQAAIVVASILGDTAVAAADYRAVPRVTFTDPEVGSVGISEALARERGMSVRVGSTGGGASTRGWIHGAGGAELVKLVEDADRGVLVGATAVGPSGGEVLSALTVAVHAEVPTARLASMIYAYPTFHRAIEVALKDLAT